MKEIKFFEDIGKIFKSKNFNGESFIYQIEYDDDYNVEILELIDWQMLFF
jgi:hypothetical protein